MIEFNQIENIGLPDNMYFGKGCEIEDVQEFTIGFIRWCLFKSCGTWYLIKQENEHGEWYELWNKQLGSSLSEAKNTLLKT